MICKKCSNDLSSDNFTNKHPWCKSCRSKYAYSYYKKTRKDLLDGVDKNALKADLSNRKLSIKDISSKYGINYQSLTRILRLDRLKLN